MRKGYAILGAIVLPFAISGCATIVNGTSEDYQIASYPEGAKVTLSNGQSCQAPCKISLKRRNDLQATYELAGYKTEKIFVQSRTGGAGVGNLLLGGIIGAGVDASNGSMNHLFPQPLSVRMVTDGSPDGAVLLDKKGEVISTVLAHNEKVAADVESGMAKQQEKADKKSKTAK